MAKLCSVGGSVGVAGIMGKKIDLCKRNWLPTRVVLGQTVDLPD